MQSRRVSTLLINSLHRSVYRAQNLMLNTYSKVKSLLYNEYGEPENVLKIVTDSIPEPNDNQVTIKWLFSPVNPADINIIQGKYPSKPPLPAVPGGEGVGEIIALGLNIKNLSIGDKVVPNGTNKGTWRTHAVYKSEEIFKVSKNLDLLQASMLNVNPCTAYRMLKDFVQLKPGDTVIQNGGNSAVGQLVIQLCRIGNINSVNIVRDRPDIQSLKDQLTTLGATVVLTEEELRTTDIFKTNKLPRPGLALNCICGKNALEVQRHLDHGGIMVTYGGMSREPLTIPPSSLIFKDLSFKGFWMTEWTKRNLVSKERTEMFDELQRLFIEQQLQTPSCKLVSLDKYGEAVTNTLKPSGKNNTKYILDLTKSE